MRKGSNGGFHPNSERLVGMPPESERFSPSVARLVPA